MKKKKSLSWGNIYVAGICHEPSGQFALICVLVNAVSQPVLNVLSACETRTVQIEDYAVKSQNPELSTGEE